MNHVSFSALPAIGEELAGGEFAGIHTKPDGTHWAVVRLPGYDRALSQGEALADAEARGGELPTKAVAVLVAANLKVKRGWYWTCEGHESITSYGWNFSADGLTSYFARSAKGGALAVRLIPLTLPV